MTSVLVIDDHDDFRGMLARTLADAGYEVTEESGGRSGLIAARTTNPDVVLLDLAMPDIDGWQVLDGIRRDSPLPAVIVLSAYQREADAVQARGRGADDYVTKPYSPGDLHARVGTAVRRGAALTAMAGSSQIEWGPLAIDLERHTVTRDGAVVDLTKSEFDLLAALLAMPHQVLTRRMLLDRTRGPEWSGDEHSGASTCRGCAGRSGTATAPPASSRRCVAWASGWPSRGHQPRPDLPRRTKLSKELERSR